MTTNSLIVFVKNPESGKAKTRIGKEVGFDISNEIYISLLEITKSIVQTVDAQKYLFYTDFVNTDDFWPNNEFHKLLQAQGGLGNKMKSAFEVALKNTHKAVIIGSDCPYITTEIVENAFEALSTVDVVIGPANDGGYYLLGLKEVIPEIFENMEWSTSDVCEETQKRLSNKSMDFVLLEPLSDIDYWEDWVNYKEDHKGE